MCLREGERERERRREREETERGGERKIDGKTSFSASILVLKRRSSFV